MFKKIRGISSLKWVTYAMMFFSALFFVSALYMTYSIDVLTSWKLELPDKKIHVGDEVTVRSIYVKEHDAKGISKRYLDCRDKNGTFLRYPLNEAVANRAARSGGTGIVVTMPDVANVPTQCKVSVAITYEALKLGEWTIREVPESNETKEFTLYPAKKASAKAKGEPKETAQTPAGASGVGGRSYVSSSQSTSTTETSQSNNSQKSTTRKNTTTTTTPAEPTPEPTPEPEPTLIERIIKPVTDLLGR